MLAGFKVKIVFQSRIVLCCRMRVGLSAALLALSLSDGPARGLLDLITFVPYY